VFEGRAGSGLLRAILNSSPDIVFEAEWMLFEVREGPLAGARQIQRAKEFFEDPKYSVLRCVGFDNKLSDIATPGEFATFLEAYDARILALRRRNVVKQVISSLNAIRSRDLTGKYHAYDPSEIVHEPFEVEPDRFDAHLERLLQRDEAMHSWVTSRKWKHLQIYYEDLVEDRAETVREIASFLDTPYEEIDLDPPGKPLKQSPKDLRNLVLNLEVLRDRYRGTRFEAMLMDRIS
jgi:hypothetical protein